MIADDGVVLSGDAEVAGLAQAGARAGVLAKDLVLRGGRKAGSERGRNADANEGVVAIVPALIEAGGAKPALFCGRGGAGRGGRRREGQAARCGTSVSWGGKKTVH